MSNSWVVESIRRALGEATPFVPIATVIYMSKRAFAGMRDKYAPYEAPKREINFFGGVPINVEPKMKGQEYVVLDQHGGVMAHNVVEERRSTVFAIIAVRRGTVIPTPGEILPTPKGKSTA